MLKIVVLAVAAACLAVPAIASAEDAGHSLDHITCADGTTLTPPFSAPVCREHGGVASVTCADGFEDGVLDFTASRFMKLPHRFADQDDALVGEDSRVLLSARTRVLDGAH